MLGPFLLVGEEFGLVGSVAVIALYAALVLAQVGSFAERMTAGRGFIAIAIVVLGRWHPLGALLAALGAGLRAQAVGAAVRAAFARIEAAVGSERYAGHFGAMDKDSSFAACIAARDAAREAGADLLIATTVAPDNTWPVFESRT